MSFSVQSCDYDPYNNNSFNKDFAFCNHARVFFKRVGLFALSSASERSVLVEQGVMSGSHHPLR